MEIKYDEQFQIVFETLDQLLYLENTPKKIYLVKSIVSV